MSEIEPKSLNEFGGSIEEFTIYCLGYWLQQNIEQSEDRHYKKLKELYETSAL